ncbi:S26 family signal peptidase [Fuerstiella marisgermanici]|uniref:Signal peptidase I n=1 Tax=Fuerstiella marisgermanici TaxID=1891926 RepID=A0A1P8WRT4_9PLAN|nr:S26 family signal peptidase [Fuerstiella marisgermanici]APZ96767.1 signal peptidase I [Fuerstiella marisgermanici]
MKQNPFRPPESQWLRNMVELSVLFIMAVIVLRGFLLEGYLISTGSMAPGLRGLHKHVACPSCGVEFAFGVTFDESVNGQANSGDEPSYSQTHAVCPNCGQVDIDVANVPVSHGDQLLVHKNVFDFRRPRRWECVVFRNPASPGEAYVKRIVGLPGETLQDIDGDLFIEGTIARKDFETQLDIRIPVFDLAKPAKSDEWQMPWQVKGPWAMENGRLIGRSDGVKPSEVDGETKAISGDTSDWLQLRHWRWTGGTQFVEVPLQSDEAAADWERCLIQMQKGPATWMTRIQFDRDNRVLRLQGVMPWQLQQNLVSWAETEEFRSAVFRLGALSHLTPVTDEYGYNSSVASPEFPVNDLMVDAKLNWTDAPECVSVRIPIDHHLFRVDLLLRAGKLELVSEDTGQTVRSAELKTPERTEGQMSTLNVIVSNFDHRIIVAIDGIPAFTELDIPLTATINNPAVTDASFRSPNDQAAETARIVHQQSRLGLGLRGGSVLVSELRLYRDVYYTPGRRKNGVERPYVLGKDCYFMQGDNSPVSSDSRNWEDPCVPHRLLVGKPFVVHLPSRPGRLSFAGFELPIRIPDFERIRYIH